MAPESWLIHICDGKVYDPHNCTCDPPYFEEVEVVRKAQRDTLYLKVKEEVERMRRDAVWADEEAEHERNPCDGSGSIEDISARAAAALCLLSGKLLRAQADRLQQILDESGEQVADYRGDGS
jgi:hypothetical protein